MARDPQLRLYKLTAPDGSSYEIAAESEQAALNTLRGRIGGSVPNREKTSGAVAEPLTVERYSPIYQAFEEATGAGLYQIIEFETIPEVVLFLPVGFPQDEITRRSKIVHDRATKLKKTVLSKRRFEAIKTASAIGLTPPIALLLIGVGVGWALSGFRGQS